MAKMSNSWKSLERKIADLMGGKRVYRGSDFSKSLPDVSHPRFLFEAKYRSNATSMYYDFIEVLKDPDRFTVVYHKDRVALRLSVFAKIYHLQEMKELLPYHVPDKKKLSKFLEDALQQASKYEEASSKMPVVVFKRRSFVDEIVYMKKGDFDAFYDSKWWEAKRNGLKVTN